MTVSCASTTLNGPGVQTQCTAVVSTSDGQKLDKTSSAQWKSTNATIAAVAADGTVTSAAPGSVTISASFEGVNNSTTITVLPLPPPRQ